MAYYSVKYQIINQKTKMSGGTPGTIVNASSVAEARQMFKSSHVDNASVKYKIISVVKTR